MSTQRNARRDDEGILKRLWEDSFGKIHFFNIKIKSWVGPTSAFGHLPFLLRLDVEEWKTFVPFKFNHAQLMENDFKGIRCMFITKSGLCRESICR